MKAISVFAALFFSATTLFFACDKSEGETPPNIDRVVKYDPDIQAIMFNHCTTCHGGPVPSANINLTTYENVRFYAESGNLAQRVNDSDNPMPPSGLLSSEERELIAKWIADGFPER